MKPLNALKKRLHNHKLLVQQEEGVVVELTFRFNPPATEDELKKLPDFAPKALLAFLKQHNGAILFDDEKGGGSALLSISEILEYKELRECPEHFIPVGMGLDGIEMVCECDRENGTNKMWIGEALNFEDEELVKFPFGFSSFVDYFIVAQGTSFWEWFVREGE